MLKGHRGEVNTVSITSDNEHIISGSSDRTIRIWNLLDQTEEIALQVYVSINAGILVDDCKYFASLYTIFFVSIWNLKEKRKESKYKSSYSSMHTLILTIDYKYIVSGSMKSVIFWNIQENLGYSR